MPKIIDNYVLQDKIGSGQFGDVYKGFNQQTHLEVAIKTIKRQTIKGKFYQLLQNEIKVLKTCDNPYIMKLYALKKTANHYYLILEYCNGGDMLGKIKKHKKLEENLVIKYLCQILSGFQTLVKHKIMHRDFKLANILLHDDNIKIADFGFSKLLSTEDYTTTMLGSPLNMAPQVLGGTKYNNKADIWSIGACMFQMLYGKPPYMANNMVDLLKTINTKPLTFPSDTKVNPVLVDVIRRMLTPDVKKRIGWGDLFTHPINSYLEGLVRKEIDLELIEDESLMINTSKYYLKKNLVVAKTEDIEEKAKLNEQLIQIVRTGEKPKYENSQEGGKAKHIDQTSKTKQQSPVKKDTKDKKDVHQQKHPQQQQQTSPHHNQSPHPTTTTTKQQQPKPSTAQSSTSTPLAPPTPNYSHIYRHNSKTLLHYRNIYAFLASVVDQLSQSPEAGSQLAAYVITKKILSMIAWLKKVLSSNQPSLKDIDRWQEYKSQQEYKEVKEYIEKEEGIFVVYGENLEGIVKEKVIKGQLGQDVRDIIVKQQFDDQMYFTYIGDYVKPLVKKVTHQTLCTKDFSFCQKMWKHIQNVLICLNFEKEFNPTNEKDQVQSNPSVFDFTKFYEEKEQKTPEQLLLKVEQILCKIC